MDVKDFTEKERQLAARTSRASGAVGEKALAPKFVESILKRKIHILNFGSGKVNADGRIPHADMLTEANGIVTNYDFPENYTKGVHDSKALDREYSIVLGSNVLNIQTSVDMLNKTIFQMARATSKTGILVVNYPLNPRKLDLAAERIRAKLRTYFQHVNIVDGTAHAPLYKCSHRFPFSTEGRLR